MYKEAPYEWLINLPIENDEESSLGATLGCSCGSTEHVNGD